jgi:hypothetical protein
MFRRALPALVVVLAAAAGRADEASDKQKTVAAANLKQAELKGFAVVESATLILATPLPEARAKAVAELLEKTVKTARKGLQFEAKEDAWKGKLTVYHIPDRNQFGTFLRGVVGVTSEAGTYVAIRSDEPFVVSGAEASVKPTDAEIAGELGTAVGAAYFQSMAGPATPVPGSIRTAYGRAASLRAEGPSGKRLTAYKAAAKTAVLGKGRGPATLAEVWANDRQDAELIATALMDYMAFGTDKSGQEKFGRFVSNLRPDENGDSPDLRKVVETAGWKWMDLESGWRTWVSKGMVVK